MAVFVDAVSLLPVVLMEDDVPSATLVELLERYSIRDLSWWIACRGRHSLPTSASKAVYCHEVCKIMQQVSLLLT